MAPDDPLKQLQLGAAINQRLQGIRDLRDRDHEAWAYIRNSLKAFFETLQDKYTGRHPNQIRAAQQAVCAAIAVSLSAGGTVFSSTGLEVVVPVKSILAFDLDMQELDTSRYCSPRVATGRVRKWQLSAEGNADIDETAH